MTGKIEIARVHLPGFFSANHSEGISQLFNKFHNLTSLTIWQSGFNKDWQFFNHVFVI